MSDALLENRVFGRDVVHVRVKEVPTDPGKVDDIALGDRAPVRVQRLADLELLEVLPERMHPIGDLLRLWRPLMRDRGQHARRSLNGRSLHIVKDTPDPTHFLSTAGPAGPAMDEMR